MPTAHLTDAFIKRLQAPERGNRIVYDDVVVGLGARTTAAGAKSFVLTYTVRGSGRQRRYTIGGCDRWTASDARAEAKRLKAMIDQGGDPLADIEAEREAPDMGDLIARFREEHFPHIRKSSADDYERMLQNYVLRHFSERTKVADVRFEDVDALHRKISKAGYLHRANRVAAMLSKAFNLAIRWGMRETNPCRGIKRHVEHGRRRYLKGDELARLTTALAGFPNQDIADAIRLLLLTGSRKAEVLTMRWEHLDLTDGTWSKPPASTKQNAPHTVPLSAPARQLLADRLGKKADGEVYVFPSTGTKPGTKRHLVNIWHAWVRLCRTAGVAELRLHDLRHSYASALASAGHSLPLIGALLGHTQASTTFRYAHLLDSPMRRATEQVGAIIANAGKEALPPTPIRRGRS
jgi:integrase